MPSSAPGAWPRTLPTRCSTTPRGPCRNKGALSLSLPFTPGNAPHRGDKVRAYFENLLPDSKDIRERIARRYRTGSTDAFDLLTEIGRGCMGALEILPAGQASAGLAPLQAGPLNEAQVAEVLRGTTTPNTLGLASRDDDFRISIAGAQEKTALLHHGGRWCLPRGSTPTTHILKLPPGLIGGMKIDMRDSVENEWLWWRTAEACCHEPSPYSSRHRQCELRGRGQAEESGTRCHG